MIELLYVYTIQTVVISQDSLLLTLMEVITTYTFTFLRGFNDDKIFPGMYYHYNDSSGQDC